MSSVPAAPPSRSDANTSCELLPPPLLPVGESSSLQAARSVTDADASSAASTRRELQASMRMVELVFVLSATRGASLAGPRRHLSFQRPPSRSIRRRPLVNGGAEVQLLTHP